MSKRIDDISIFGEYNQPENRITAAFLQICKEGKEPLISYLFQKTGLPFPSSDISIFSQQKENESVPDGLLESCFSFRLYVESKIKEKAINKVQMNNHLKLLQRDRDFLIYLTPDEERPRELDAKVYWSNWQQIVESLTDYINNYKSEDKLLIDFLYGHFKTLLENHELLGNKWDLNNNQVMIVAASWAENVALKYNYYMCQNRRRFRPSKYIAFYNNGRIRNVFEILEPPKDDINLRCNKKFDEYLTNTEPNYGLNELRKVFSIRKIEDLDIDIVNDTVDKNHNNCPYTYGQPRYTDFETFLKAKKTSDLSSPQF